MAPAVVLTVVVTGCSGGGDSSAPSKLPAAGTAAPSATPTPPPSPSPQAEVEAAVRRYYDAVNMAVVSGETSSLVQLSTPTCGCRKLVDSIRDSFANGRSTGAHFSLASVMVQEVQGNTAIADVTYTVSAYQDVDRQGKVVESYDLYDGHDLLYFVRQSTAWTINDAVHVNPGATS
jgi:hypothetical protein